MVTDNARAMVAVGEQIFTKYPTILQLKCAAQIMNLLMKDFFTHVTFIKNSLVILNNYIASKDVKRWCSIFDRLCDLKYLLQTSDKEDDLAKLSTISNVSETLQPFMHVLNLAQTDGVSYPSIYAAFDKAVTSARKKGLDGVVAVCEKRRMMLKNELVSLHSLKNNPSDYNSLHENRIKQWLLARGLPEFDRYLADVEFLEPPEMPRRLRLFIDHRLCSITSSEAAVERCFSMHKMVHSRVRANLSDEIVNDVLFIRYNKQLKYSALLAPYLLLKMFVTFHPLSNSDYLRGCNVHSMCLLYQC